MTSSITEISSTLKQVHTVIANMESNQEELRANWCVPNDTGRFLQIITAQNNARRILEVGTSIGYSALNFSAGCLEGTQNSLDSSKAELWSIDTIDASEERTSQAKANFENAGVNTHIHCHIGQALDILKAFSKETSTQTRAKYDILFLDARKSEYIDYLNYAETLLRQGGLLIADNTQSHREQMADFVDAIHASSNWLVSDLDTSNGLILGHYCA